MNADSRSSRIFIIWKEEHLVVVRRWELQDTAKIWKNRTLQKDLQTNPSRQVVALIGSILEHVMAISFADWVSSTNMDWLLRSHRAEKRRQDNASHGRPHDLDNLPWSNMLNRAKQHRESNITQSAKPIENGNRGQGRLDTPGGKKARRRKGGHQTLTLLA